jgi:DGQHR domain-containing protein
MASMKKGRKSQRKGKLLTPDEIRRREKLAFEKNMNSLFKKMDSINIKSDGVEIVVKDRTGEIDDLFIYKNVIIIAEYYTGKPDTTHLLKKQTFYKNITDDVPGFLKICRIKYPGFTAVMEDLALYPEESFIVKNVYASKMDPSSELITSCPTISFMYGVTTNYFGSLVSTIGKSARIEFLKFLGVNYENVGDSVINSSQNPKVYQGFLLPKANSSYPDDYKIVSFYADPETLLAKSYVLRRDSWRDDAHLYQRVLDSKKIKKMREYLIDKKRVFINNIIVTLPCNTKINEYDDPGENIPHSQLGKVKPVSLQIPDGFDEIGIVDGQHRIFCYHEGSDAAESSVKILRKRQNLLVTGIVYPSTETEYDRRIFEAKLFLEINDNQTRTRSALKQEIELIVNPESTTAIARKVVAKLARAGAYKDVLQTSFFDNPNKIKTSSIVSYALPPIVKFEGPDSLFSRWPNNDKHLLKSKKANRNVIADLADEYVDYCSSSINDFMLAVKLAYGTNNWDLEAKPRSEMLSVTSISGLIVCLRQIIENTDKLSFEDHKISLKDVKLFQFGSYKSSQWKRLGTDFFQNHYNFEVHAELVE